VDAPAWQGHLAGVPAHVRRALEDWHAWRAGVVHQHHRHGSELLRFRRGRALERAQVGFDARTCGYDVRTPVIDPAVARGSRAAHSPFSTAAMKRSTVVLKSSGSSRFSV